MPVSVIVCGCGGPCGQNCSYLLYLHHINKIQNINCEAEFLCYRSGSLLLFVFLPRLSLLQSLLQSAIISRARMEDHQKSASSLAPPEKAKPRVSQLSNNQIGELKEAFRFFDRDRNGNIDIEELQHVLKTLGQEPTQQELEEMISSVDLDDNGEIDFEEFVQMMENRMFLPSNKTEYQDCFKFFDKNGDGFVDFHELKEVLLSLGEDNITDQDVQDMIDEADLNDDGKVDFDGMYIVYDNICIICNYLSRYQISCLSFVVFDRIHENDANGISNGSSRTK